MNQLLRQLRKEGVLSALDEQLAAALCTLAGEADEHLRLAVALVSRHVAQGHVCLPLDELARPELALGDDLAALRAGWPSREAWLRALRASALCGTSPDETTPLVLDERERLYLRRHFDRERALAAALEARAQRSLPSEPQRVAARLSHHFGDEPGDLQRAAAELATRRALCVISGGPGTGKTSTVVKLLAVLVEEAFAAERPAPRIALTAPTGKAAVRLESAVRAAKRKLTAEPRVLAAIPEGATTIHRMLRSRERRIEPGAPAAPLAVDLLVVDEASMVDLELMTELMCAAPEQAQVILLGDRDQLASVEAGAVLGDICGAKGPPLDECVIQLTRSYRFAAESGIDLLARAVQAGDAARALAILDDPRYPEVTLDEADPLASGSAFAREAIDGYRQYIEAWQEPARALALFDQFRVLTAHRRGDRGVEALNRKLARWLFDAGLIERSDGNYFARPIIVTENDYRTQLWNGDVGCIARGSRSARVAWFQAADGSLREFGFGSLPPHESAFVLSVHKSQGSEVDVVSLILPAELSRLLSRELLYTAITRARRRVTISGARDVLSHAVSRAVTRSTGLRDLLLDV